MANVDNGVDIKKKKVSLDQEIEKILTEKKGTIIVVDDSCWKVNDYYPSDYVLHAYAEDECKEFIKHNGIDLLLVDFSHEEVMKGNQKYKSILRSVKSRGLQKPSFAVVKINKRKSFGGICKVGEKLLTAEKLRKDFPGIKIINYKSNHNGHMSEMALIKGLSTLYGSEFAKVYSDAQMTDFENFPTMMHILFYQLTGTMVPSYSLSRWQHSYKNDMWKKFLPYIDKSLRAGNMQTRMNYHFLVLSDKEFLNLGDNRPYANEKVIVHDFAYYPKEEDFENCAAIFIDNNWVCGPALGTGIETLREVSGLLKRFNKKVPILYLSGHNLDGFQDHEKELIASHGAILGTKDFFPKVCMGRSLYEKEKLVSQIASKNDQLAKYTTKVYNFNNGGSLDNENLFIVCTKIIGQDRKDEANEKTKNTKDNEKTLDHVKQELFDKLGIEDDKYNHRMYVLSMFHTEMKNHVDDVLFNKRTYAEFFSFNKLKMGLCDTIEQEQDFEKYKRLYENISKNSEHYEKRTVAHNDTKDDNWFDSEVLGDYSGAAAGAEYKDIARALLDQGFELESGCDIGKVIEYVGNYVKLRNHFDNDFVVKNTFTKRSIERVFTESLRLARFVEMSYEYDNSVVKNYLDVADTVFDYLYQN